jgi:hypothetical protein
MTVLERLPIQGEVVDRDLRDAGFEPATSRV